jgi:hypothetical protein
MVNQQLEDLQAKAIDLIAKYAAEYDPAAIARVAALLNKLAAIEAQILTLQKTLEEYAADAYSKCEPQDDTIQRQDTRAFRRKRLKITINWDRLGKGGGTETICENFSSYTMVKWATRLYEDLGPHRLVDLSEFRISRGPMVSRNPQLDFVNKVDGSLYAHHPIKDS